MPITFYNECEALQIPSGSNGADGLSAVSATKDFPSTIPQIDPSNLYSSGSLYASAVGAYGYEWLIPGVFFALPTYGIFEVHTVGATTATEKLIYFKNRGAAGNLSQGTTIPVGTLIIPSGPAGSNGSNGATILNGTSAPTSGQGSNGDFFINTATSTIYGPKASGVWPAGVPLIGATGATGASGGTLLGRGAGAPSLNVAHLAFINLTSSVFSFSAGQLSPYEKITIRYSCFVYTKFTAGTSDVSIDTFNFTINYATPSVPTGNLHLPESDVIMANNGSLYTSTSIERNGIAATSYKGSFCHFTIEILLGTSSIVGATVKFDSFDGKSNRSACTTYSNLGSFTKATEAISFTIFASPNCPNSSSGAPGQGTIIKPLYDITAFNLI
jgi:hypothetical protein